VYDSIHRPVDLIRSRPKACPLPVLVLEGDRSESVWRMDRDWVGSIPMMRARRGRRRRSRRAARWPSGGTTCGTAGTAAGCWPRATPSRHASTVSKSTWIFLGALIPFLHASLLNSNGEPYESCRIRKLPQCQALSPAAALGPARPRAHKRQVCKLRQRCAAGRARPREVAAVPANAHRCTNAEQISPIFKPMKLI
jgi:hypothetical protein